MAFGKHWEWRGFGSLPSALSDRLEALPLKFDSAQELTDEYLWAPGLTVNVKLRLGDLKVKRSIERSGGLERWLEDPLENYAFPLEDRVLDALARDLDILLPAVGRGPVTRGALLDLLRRADPPVQLVAVKKRRWQRLWGAGGAGGAVTVEIAEISSPERTASVGIEHAERARVEEARDALGLAEALNVMSYLEALPLWAAGRTLANRW
ncbi:MAG TPA: hypothetical protein VMT52_09180 [Planctomycetota bacterium]|nr:hypothetical protein [Planctomycetota bacterium]